MFVHNAIEWQNNIICSHFIFLLRTEFFLKTWTFLFFAVKFLYKRMYWISVNSVWTPNMLIQRPRYPMPTPKENLHHLVNAKCFTLTNAPAYFSLVFLDRESSFLTSMHTLIWHVRWLRLPFKFWPWGIPADLERELGFLFMFCLPKGQRVVS